VLGAEQGLGPLDRQLLEAYLLVALEASASSTPGQAKFSEAISSIVPRWRSSSRPSKAAMSGSTSDRPAER
jgi:hypothetical protein